jgi:hypothetical protein
MPQRLKLSSMTEKRLKMNHCGQFKSLWHSRLGQSFLLVFGRNERGYCVSVERGAGINVRILEILDLH